MVFLRRVKFIVQTDVFIQIWGARALTSAESPIIFDTLDADKNTDKTRMFSHVRLSIKTD